MKSVLSFLVFFFICTTNAQNNTIDFGEKLVFSASYNMSGLLTDIAQITMETSKVSTSSNTLMRLKCTAATYNSFDSFFKIRDLYESYVSPNSLNPYLYKRDINEGGYYKFMQYKFKRKSGTVERLMKKKRGDGTIWESKKKLSYSQGTKDLVSTLYTLRNLDIHKASIGDSSSFKVLFDDEISTVTFKLLGKETISTKIGRKECYKIAIGARGNNADVLKGNNSNIIWLTADKNKIPVLAKFKIPVGNGELKIKSATGLKN